MKDKITKFLQLAVVFSAGGYIIQSVEQFTGTEMLEPSLGLFTAFIVVDYTRQRMNK